MVLLERAGAWPEGGDLALSVGPGTWEGVGQGHGHLNGRRAEVHVSGRHAAGRVTECALWLPGGSGVVEEAVPEEAVPEEEEAVPEEEEAVPEDAEVEAGRWPGWGDDGPEAA